MPAPRIFVSSTCYDLQEVRVNLRSFIENFGYDPIMSDFGDIFYDFYGHVQDSCIKAIQDSDMYILIIGDYYGSTYHKDIKIKSPDSVTLKEFKRAIDLKKPKIIFINKFVNYDYRNYKRYLNNQFKDYFLKNNVNDDDIDIKKIEVKKDLDDKYPFPKESYKYVFKFLDMMDELDDGNAYFTFESSKHIKNELKKQWAGFLQESLKSKVLNKIESENLKKVETKIDALNTLLESLIENTSSKESELTIDIANLSQGLYSGKIEELKNQLEQLLNQLFNRETSPHYFQKNIEFLYQSSFSKGKIIVWFDNLKILLEQYKWSKYIDLSEIFKPLNTKYTVLRNKRELPYKTVLDLYSIYLSVSKNDIDSFIKTIIKEFEIYVDDEEFPF